jgi:hypothetical protein
LDHNYITCICVFVRAKYTQLLSQETYSSATSCPFNDISKSTWTDSSTGLEADVSIGLGHGLGISQFSERLGTLADTVQTYYGGAYANIAILGLAMYWLVRCQPREPANIFLLIFMSTALIPLFIGDYVLQSHVLYEIPFQIPAAISFYTIGKKNGKLIFIALLLIASYLSF